MNTIMESSTSQRFFNQVDQLVPVIQVLPAIMIIIIIIFTIIVHLYSSSWQQAYSCLFIFINIMTMIISICNKMIPRQPYLGWRAQERLKLSSSYLNPPTQVIIIVIIISWLSPQIIKMIAIPILIIVAAAVGLLNTQPASPLLHLWVKPAWQECTKQNNTGGRSQLKHSSWSSFSWCPILATNSANLSTYYLP